MSTLGFFFFVRRVRKTTGVAEGTPRSRPRALPPLNVKNARRLSK